MCFGDVSWGSEETQAVQLRLIAFGAEVAQFASTLLIQ